MMAVVDIYPNSQNASSSPCSSPRISFSHDIHQNHLPVKEDMTRTAGYDDSSSSPSPRLDKSLLGGGDNHNDPASHQISSDEFNFCFNTDQSNLNHNQVSPADELFMNGILIPIQMPDNNKVKNHTKENNNIIDSRIVSSRKQIVDDCSNHRQPASYNSGGQQTINAMKAKELGRNEEKSEEEIMIPTRETLIREEKSQSKSFWRFNRSTSLNCENTKKNPSFWSLQLLSRSNSTGSSSSSSSSIKQQNNRVTYNHKHQQGSKSSPPSSSSSSSNGNRNGNGMNRSKKPPLMKQSICNNNGYNYGSNSPVLNVPPPYIAKGTSDLLGFGSLFRNSKDKKNKKR